MFAPLKNKYPITKFLLLLLLVSMEVFGGIYSIENARIIESRCDICKTYLEILSTQDYPRSPYCNRLSGKSSPIEYIEFTKLDYKVAKTLYTPITIFNGYPMTDKYDSIDSVIRSVDMDKETALKSGRVKIYKSKKPYTIGGSQKKRYIYKLSKNYCSGIKSGNGADSSTLVFSNSYGGLDIPLSRKLLGRIPRSHPAIFVKNGHLFLDSIFRDRLSNKIHANVYQIFESKIENRCDIELTGFI